MLKNKKKNLSNNVMKDKQIITDLHSEDDAPNDRKSYFSYIVDPGARSILHKNLRQRKLVFQ